MCGLNRQQGGKVKSHRMRQGIPSRHTLEGYLGGIPSRHTKPPNSTTHLQKCSRALGFRGKGGSRGKGQLKGLTQGGIKGQLKGA